MPSPRLAQVVDGRVEVVRPPSRPPLGAWMRHRDVVEEVRRAPRRSAAVDADGDRHRRPGARRLRRSRRGRGSSQDEDAVREGARRTSRASPGWRRSRRNRISRPRPNWVDASTSATIVIENPTPATVIIEPAIVDSSARAPSAPPVYTHGGNADPASAVSSASATAARATAPRTIDARYEPEASPAGSPSDGRTCVLIGRRALSCAEGSAGQTRSESPACPIPAPSSSVAAGRTSPSATGRGTRRGFGRNGLVSGTTGPSVSSSEPDR